MDFRLEPRPFYFSRRSQKDGDHHSIICHKEDGPALIDAMYNSYTWTLYNTDYK